MPVEQKAQGPWAGECLRWHGVEWPRKNIFKPMSGLASALRFNKGGHEYLLRTGRPDE
jgi:hypothetical protein